MALDLGGLRSHPKLHLQYPLMQRLARFSVWRWCFFLGCWPPIYWGTRLLMWGLTKFAECRLFTARTAVYFLVGASSRGWVGVHLAPPEDIASAKTWRNG